MFNKFEIIEQNKRIDNFVENILDDYRIRGFYPSTISKELDIPLTDVLKRMYHINKDKSGIIKIKYEIRCENQHILDIVDDYNNYLNSYMYCMKCNEDIYITKNNISLKYVIDSEYRNYKKKTVV